MSMSNYLENKVLDHTLRGTPYVQPSGNLYMALYTSDPTDADTGIEVIGNAYARQTVTFSLSTLGSSTTSADVNFPVTTGAWGTVTHAGIRDALTGGNLLYSGALSVAQSILTSNQFVVKAGQFTINLD